MPFQRIVPLVAHDISQYEPVLPFNSDIDLLQVTFDDGSFVYLRLTGSPDARLRPLEWALDQSLMPNDAAVVKAAEGRMLCLDSGFSNPCSVGAVLYLAAKNYTRHSVSARSQSPVASFMSVQRTPEIKLATANLHVLRDYDPY